MRDLLRDPDDDVFERIRKRMLRASGPAVRKLGSVARGDDGFRDDHQRGACLALARISCTLIRGAVAAAAAEPAGLGYHPIHTPERAAELLATLMAENSRGDDDRADQDDNHDQHEEAP